MDLHIHSRHSPDSLSKPEKIVSRAKELGLRAIAVTDHDSWDGYREAVRYSGDDLIVVPGAELKTDRGDLLALFVEDEVSSRNWASAIDEIRASGGLAVVPHPFESKKLSKDDIRLADAVEVFNAKCSYRSNAAAKNLAAELQLPGIASSDAHMIAAIGNGRTHVPGFSSNEELRRHILRDAKVSNGVMTNPILHYGNGILCFGLKGVWKKI